jgi:NADH-ubiquinone oxidoreductase chain 4
MIGISGSNKETLATVSTLIYGVGLLEFTKEDFILIRLVGVTGKALVMLRRVLTALMLYARFSVNLSIIFNSLLKLSLAVLVLSFSVESLITFYYYFESILIPIFILILGWGYQPERFGSALFILFYTLLLSLPLLVTIVSVGRERGSTFF